MCSDMAALASAAAGLNATAKCLLAMRHSSGPRIRLEALYFVWSALLGGGNLADALAAQSLVKPSALHSSEPTPLCTKNNPVGSYFFFTEASRG